MVEIREMLAPLNTACRPGRKRTGMLGITIHETANTSQGAGALNHARYLQGGGQYAAVSWHYCVDDKLITRSIPEDEIAWHAGDGGGGNGNNKTISIEICVNPDSNYETAKKNAMELSTDILIRHGFHRAEEALYIHRDWSGKNCPTRIIAANKWPEFKGYVQMFMNNEKPAPYVPGTHSRSFIVFNDIAGYVTASDARAGTNQVTTVAKGDYFVYREASGAVNLTKTDGRPGAWVDCHSNALEQMAQIHVGDTVRLSGYVYRDSLGAGQGANYYNALGKVTIITDLNRTCPYHFETIGWVTPDSIQLVSQGDGGSVIQTFNVGDKVKIKLSAAQYSRSTKYIPEIYKNKPYTIMQVGNDDVLLRELYSWVKKTDVTKA